MGKCKQCKYFECTKGNMCINYLPDKENKSRCAGCALAVCRVCAFSLGTRCKLRISEFIKS